MVIWDGRKLLRILFPERKSSYYRYLYHINWLERKIPHGEVERWDCVFAVRSISFWRPPSVRIDTVNMFPVMRIYELHKSTFKVFGFVAARWQSATARRRQILKHKTCTFYLKILVKWWILIDLSCFLISFIFHQCTHRCPGVVVSWFRNKTCNENVLSSWQTTRYLKKAHCDTWSQFKYLGIVRYC